MCLVPEIRIQSDDSPVRSDGDFILYWMTAARRTRHNFGLQRAVQLANEFDRPLLVFEPLRIGYRWASDRFHRFVVDGMADQARKFASHGITYFPYVERSEGEGSGLLEALAASACTVVTDAYPGFFHTRMQDAASQRLDVRLERVDGNGLFPLAATEGAFPTAYAFRRFLQRELPAHLDHLPLEEPLAHLEGRAGAVVPAGVERSWPRVTDTELADPEPWIGKLPIDHEVRSVDLSGGEGSALTRLDAFIDSTFARYADARNHPEDPVNSGLSSYLHFGHIGSAEIFRRVSEHEYWTPDMIAPRASGARAGWWGMSEAAEGFLDQLITWRELGFVFCTHVPDYAEYESLPDWARKTLEEHAADDRPHIYTLEELERGETHDPLWNAAQGQLVREGVIHNYLRMLWGKKVLEWSRTPRDGFENLIELNNRFAIDGRDPNSYSGIAWTFGRFDRAWGPERPIFGKIRYMSSENTGRKVRVRGYIREFTA